MKKGLTVFTGLIFIIALILIPFGCSLPQNEKNNSQQNTLTSDGSDVSFASTTLVLQAEDALISGGTASSANSGYSGTGYADLTGTAGSYVEWTFTMAQAGSATIKWYISNGTGSSVTYSVTANSADAGGNKSFSSTGSWTSWTSTSRSVSLPAGTIKLRVTALNATSDGVNFDRLEVTSSYLTGSSSSSAFTTSSSSSSSSKTSSSSTTSSSKSSSTTSSSSSSSSSSTSSSTGPQNPPQNLMVPPMGYDDTSITVIWSKPSEYSNVDSYNVYQNGTLVSNTKNLFYNAAGLSSGSSYSFTVTAKTKSGTESASSNSVTQSTTSPQIFNILNYGAVGNGTTLDTAAIQSAIDACTAGGKVLIPSGKTFLSGAIFLKSNMTLQIDGTLRGSDNAADYPKTSIRFPYYASGNNYTGLINAYTSTYYSITNVRICGSGTVNGASNTVGSITGHGITKLGTSEANASGSEDSDRGDMINAKGVNGLYIGGLTLVNPAMHTIFVSYSKNITINGITANTYDIHNADGIDLATSDTTYIFNSTFDTGDDCINFNAGVGASGVAENYPCSNIRVFDCTTKRGHGGVVFGSFTAAWIQNVLIEDCTFDGTEIGLRFKTGASNGGGARNIVARDLVIKNISKDSAIFLDSTYDSSYSSGGAGQFHDITVYNVTCTTMKKYGIYVNGSSSAPYYNINLKNISITGGSSGGAYLNYCKTSTFDTVTITSSGTAWKISNSSALKFPNCSPAQADIP